MKLMLLLDDGTLHEVVSDFQQFDLSHPIARDVFLMELIADLKALGYDATTSSTLACPDCHHLAHAGRCPGFANCGCNQGVRLEHVTLEEGIYIGPIQHDPVMCKPGKCPGPHGCWCAECEKGDHPA
jgi:hypothetical protein